MWCGAFGGQVCCHELRTAGMHSLTLETTESFEALRSTLSSLVQVSTSSSVHVKLSVYYTRAFTDHGSVKDSLCLPSGLSLHVGRPMIGDILESLATRMITDKARTGCDALSGVIVGVCGPTSLGEEVRDAIGCLDVAIAKAVGGVELHEE
jgi:ferric-chelate reductase